MSQECGRILTQAVALLRELAFARAAPSAAFIRVAEWRSQHLGLRADLLVHRPPASDCAEYDLLLGLPEDRSDTIALSWRADRGEPWTVNYADHWASNYLVTVNDTSTTVQEALLYLRGVHGNYPDLMNVVVEHHLLSEGVKANPPFLSLQELQDGADHFRQAHGLFTAEATQRWLAEARLSMTQFEQLVTENVQRRKFKQKLLEDLVPHYFEMHRQTFDTVRLCQVQVAQHDAADRLAAAARDREDLHGVAAEWLGLSSPPAGLAVTMCVAIASQLPEWIREASQGAVLGPVRENRCWNVAQVNSRHPTASLDGATKDAVADTVFREWLAEQRERATIRWHWM